MRCSNSYFQDNAIVQPVFKTKFFAPERFLTLKNLINYPGDKSAHFVCRVAFCRLIKHLLCRVSQYASNWIFLSKNPVKYFLHFFR